jgi:hypothetical protein
MLTAQLTLLAAAGVAAISMMLPAISPALVYWISFFMILSFR